MPSQVVRRYTYDQSQRSLDILFVTGRLYRYSGVPQDVANAMKSAFAKGEFFNAQIRGRYPATRLDAAEPDLFNVSKAGRS